MKGSANTKPPVEIDSSVEWISYTQLQNVKGFDILREKFAIPAPLIDYLDYANLYRGSAVFLLHYLFNMIKCKLSNG